MNTSMSLLKKHIPSGSFRSALLVGAVAFTFGVVSLPAQEPTPPAPGGAEGSKQGLGEPSKSRPVPPMIAALDSNGDGVISTDELSAANARLKTLDVNKDGQLTMDELRPQRGGQGKGWEKRREGADDKGPAGGNPDKRDQREKKNRPVPPLIGALDPNGDHEITADEIAAASAHLKALDKNGDGKLTRDELMPPRREHPENKLAEGAASPAPAETPTQPKP
jgi:Ca2+-binding EF-hand superfamily protein